MEEGIWRLRILMPLLLLLIYTPFRCHQHKVANSPLSACLRLGFWLAAQQIFLLRRDERPKRTVAGTYSVLVGAESGAGQESLEVARG
jgi:hypothetical protein